MPKPSKLESMIFYKGPTSRGRAGKYRLYMEWDSQCLQYKKNRWKKLFFRSITSWEAVPGGYLGNIIDSKRPPRIILKSAGRSRTEERQFIIRHEEFENWLYWIIRGILKYSNATVPDSQLSGLSSGRRAKITTRRDMKAFDASHRVFVTTLERLDMQTGQLKQTPAPAGKGPFGGRFQSKPRSRGGLPDHVDEGPAIDGRTQSGIAYSAVGSKIGSGRGDTAIFEIRKLLAPIVKKTSGGLGHKLVRPAEPMVVKVPRLSQSSDGSCDASSYKDLIREARILAALGVHPNIVGLIDAHLHSANRLYLFLEKGYLDLSAYRPKKMRDSSRSPLLPPQIRKYTMGILAGIAHMHQRRIYHLDMKPENVIVCKADVSKIIDFGLAKTRILDSRENMFDEQWPAYGTKGYIPPESGTDGFYKKEMDLIKRDAYAVGMTIIEVLLAPRYHWQSPNLKTGQVEGVQQIKQRIHYWQKKIRSSRDRNRMTRDGLLIIADAAAGLIEENPEIRLTVEDAMNFVKIDLQQRRKARTRSTDPEGMAGVQRQLREHDYLKDRIKNIRR